MQQQSPRLDAAPDRIRLSDIPILETIRLVLRPATLPAIHTWKIDEDHIAKPPKGVTHVVLDTPAGLHGKRLDSVMKIADRMLIPLQPSLFDIQATHAFLAALREHPRAADIELGLVAMRGVGARLP